MVAKIGSERNLSWDFNHFQINKDFFIKNNQNKIKTIVIEEEKQRDDVEEVKQDNKLLTTDVK